MSASFLAFLGVATLVIVTPGPDTAVTIRNTLLGGRQGGIATASGVAVGQTIWAAATSAGLVALLLASEPLFAAVRLIGAGYLILLGCQALLAAVRPTPIEVLAPPTRRLAAAAGFRQGLISDLGNPKMAAFFTSLLPQFAPDGGTSFLGLALLGTVFALMTLAWLALYTVAVDRAGQVLRRPAVRRSLEAVTGTVLIALGLRVATEQR